MKKIITLMLLLSISVFSACGNAKDDYKSIEEIEAAKATARNEWATKALDGGTFEERIEVLTEYNEANLFTDEMAIKLSASLREDIQTELDKGNLESAYEMSVKLFHGMALQENIDMLAKNAKSFAQTAFENKEYQKSVDAAAIILQLHWDEEAMDLKLAAEFELLKIAIEKNDLVAGQRYFDDIMDITGLKGNENLAKKYRENTQKFSDKFPDSKFNQ